MPAVMCPFCRTPFRAPDSAAESTRPCPGCGAAVRVPSKPSSDAVPVGREPRPDPSRLRTPPPGPIGSRPAGPGNPTPAPPTSARRKPRRTEIDFGRPGDPRRGVVPLWVWVAGGVGVLALAGLAAVAFLDV